MASKNQRWKRHYPLLLLAALQVLGILLCVMDLYRRQNILKQSLKAGSLECAVSGAVERNSKEQCVFLMSALPNTCVADAAAFTMPLR